jgi:hypothetical protein
MSALHHPECGRPGFISGGPVDLLHLSGHREAGEKDPPPVLHALGLEPSLSSPPLLASASPVK